MTSSPSSAHDAWSAGQSYDHYMGRWSREVVARFLDWLSPPTDAAWLEVGCGTGALTSSILSECSPRSVLATDASNAFVDHAKRAIVDTRVRFEVSDGCALPIEAGTIDVVASALVLKLHTGPCGCTSRNEARVKAWRAACILRVGLSGRRHGLH